MKKLALKAVGMIAIVTASSCGGGGWQSALSATNWKSTTIVPTAMTNGVTASAWTLRFAAHTDMNMGTATGGTATGPFTSTYVETYGPTASSSLQGCVITATCTGTYSEVGVLPVTGTNTAMGTVDAVTETCTCAAASCTTASGNGPFTTGCSQYANTGGSVSYSITSGNLVLTQGTSGSNSLTPYHAAMDNYTFMTTTAM